MSFPSSPFEPPQATPQAPRSKTIWVLLLIGGVLLFPCLCCGGFLVVAGRGASIAIAERDNIEKAVNDYMQRLENKDVAGAYALFSPRSKGMVPQSKLQEQIDGQNYSVYSDFQRATINHIQIMTSPTRTVARVNGTVRYEGGVSGTFQGTLGREGNRWLIDGMNITVPPSKFGAAKSN
jgi:hypothetical protein